MDSILWMDEVGLNSSSKSQGKNAKRQHKNHIYQIFFLLAGPIYFWEMVSCTNTNGALQYKRKCQVGTGSTYPIRQAFGIDSAGVSGNENTLNKRRHQS
jgi:hypothetical protein